MKQKNHSTSESKVLLIGIDGATWDIIDPMIEKGLLPNFQKLVDEGSRATLQSLEVPASPRVWTSIATGKTENKHGIMDFYSHLGQLKCKRIWDILSEKGESIGIFYWYLTWPPERNLNGFMVPGILARDNRTTPENLSFIKNLELSEKKRTQNKQSALSILQYWKNGVQALRYGVRFQTLLKAAVYKILEKMNAYTELNSYFYLQNLKLHLHTDIFTHLLKQQTIDFAAILFPQVDQISHKFWAYFDPDNFEERIGRKVPEKDKKKYGGVVPDIYRQLDHAIGRIIEAINDDYTIMVVSDHGFGIIEELYSQLKIRGNIFLEKLGLRDFVHGVSIGAHFIIQIDVPSYRNKLNSIVSTLKKITIVEDNEPLFAVSVSNGEIMLELRKIWNVPLKDSELLLEKHIRIGENVLPVNEILVHRFDISGDHRQNGILILKGGNIKKKFQMQEASVLDITPTILYLKKLAVGKDMDGNPLIELFEPDFSKKYTPQYIDSYESGEQSHTSGKYGDIDHSMTEEIEKRLKGLGYIN